MAAVWIVPALIAGLAVALVVATVAPRLSQTTLAVSVLVIGYVLGYDVWHADAGPVPLTLDRLALAAFGALTLWRLAKGRLPSPTPIGLDWAVAVVCGWLTVSCVLNRPPEEVQLPTSPIFRLVVSFWAPAVLYAALRSATVEGRDARRLMAALAALGLYLAVTAVLETAGVWSLVFPRYIANPELGLHFGRARGPALNSVSLGVYLSLCAIAAWLLAARSSRPMQLLLVGAAGLMALGVVLTMTRSTWLGLAGAAVTVGSMQLPRTWRLTAFVTTCVVGAATLFIAKDAIVGLEREDSAEVSAHSAQQRLAFLYVSDQMFRDHPLWGVGFGRFLDKKLPYLTDRRQWFELESIRELHHHNTFLSLLVETGMLGLAGYLAVLAGFAWVGWRLAHDPLVGADANRLGLLLIAAVVNYLPSAMGHDLTLVHSDQWLLFVVGGAATGCWVNHPERVRARAFQAARPPGWAGASLYPAPPRPA